jgi:molybdenum cofactor cytidylyltransferase
LIHAAIILAAGRSRRMGTDKACLPFGNLTAVERIITAHRNAGARQIIVVTGMNTRTLYPMALDATMLENPHPERGMLSSVRTGIRGLAPAATAFFIHPVDIPLVSLSVLQGLLKAAARQPDNPVFIPTFNDRRGHPPLVHRRLAADILAHTGGGGLRFILQRHFITEVACHEPGILWDMDTTKDYQRLLTSFRLCFNDKGENDDDSDSIDAGSRCPQGG